MGEGGFELVKWKSNAHQLMEGDPNVAIPIADKQDQDDKPTKVLGVSWLPAEDAFVFICDDEFKAMRAKTPRQFVSMQAKTLQSARLLESKSIHQKATSPIVSSTTDRMGFST